MKTLGDGSEVVDFAYYFLLEWCEKNQKEEIERNFGTNQVCKLKRKQFKQLFQIAMNEVYREI